MKAFRQPNKLTLKRDRRRSQEHRCLERKSKGFLGIRNLGNTCYCNAVIQALRCCPAFWVILHKQPAPGENLIKVLNKLVQELDRTDVVAISPLELMEVLRASRKFDAGLQHDAAEFLSYLLSQCVKIEDFAAILKGTLELRTRCLDCGDFTQQREDFLHISVPIISEDMSGFVREHGSCNSLVSLSWCLSRFTSHERLSRENKFWCESCRHLVEAERSTLFHCLPPLIIIHLKRFSVQDDGGSVKVATNVAIPLSLNFMSWSVENCYGRGSIYWLCAVVLHCGSSSNSGHYTSMVKFSRKWLYCDDDCITSVSDTDVQQILSPIQNDCISPYLLFFCKK